MATRGTRVRPVQPVPPGEILRAELEARGWTQPELAEIMGRPLTALNQIIVGKKQVTPETATELGRALGTTPEFWLNLESAYRLSEAQDDEAQTKLEGIEIRLRLREAVPCLAELRKRGWIAPTDDGSELLARVLAFFRVPDLTALQAASCTASFRRSAAATADPVALLAWVRRAEHMAETLPTSPYTQARLEAALPALLDLAAGDTGAAGAPELLARVGLPLVLVRQLPKTKVDGAVIWRAGRPLLALSLRHDRLDWFWFTLLHELAHLVLGHTGDHLDALEPGAEDPQETAANQFAMDLLIPPDQFEGFTHSLGATVSYRQVQEFADRIGRHPGIVVGRLQWEELVPQSHLNRTKAKVRHRFGM